VADAIASILLRTYCIALSPLAMWTAFPSSDYYGDSAPYHRDHRSPRSSQ